MAVIKWLVGGLVSLAALILVLGFILPSQVHVEREIVIDAPPSEVFSLISDFEEWDAWSPWAKMDPDAEMMITGSGLGQTMTWSSDDPNVGSGTQEIVQIDAPNLLKTHLDFGDMGVADATFKLTPVDDKTQVTWSLDTDMREGVTVWSQPISTYFGFLMDSMIGKDYEAGLQALKTASETDSKT